MVWWKSMPKIPKIRCLHTLTPLSKLHWRYTNINCSIILKNEKPNKILITRRKLSRSKTCNLKLKFNGTIFKVCKSHLLLSFLAFFLKWWSTSWSYLHLESLVLDNDLACTIHSESFELPKFALFEVHGSNISSNESSSSTRLISLLGVATLALVLDSFLIVATLCLAFWPRCWVSVIRSVFPLTSPKCSSSKVSSSLLEIFGFILLNLFTRLGCPLSNSNCSFFPTSDALSILLRVNSFLFFPHP